MLNILIAGYVQHGHIEEAVKFFHRMQLMALCPDIVTFLCTLKACGNVGALRTGQQIHAEVARRGFLRSDNIIGNALIEMYSSCGLLEKAHEVFEKLSVQDIISWTVLIAGYIEHGQSRKALSLYETIKLNDISPDKITYCCALKACGSLAVRIKGEELHFEIVKLGFLERDIVIGNNLIDMYAKCGSVEESKRVFEKLHIRDTGSWNALISGYDQLGDCHNVLRTFDEILNESIKPDRITFLIVLNTCNRQCLYAMGEKYFDTMIEDYGIIPTLEHHTAMIDLLGRSGQLEKMIHMIEKLPFCPDAVVWHTLLSACRKWGHVELASQAFEQSLCLEENGIIFL